MKRLNIKQLATALLAIFAVTFTGCKDEDPVYDSPSVEVSTATITMDAGADNDSFTITANRPWTIAIQKEEGDDQPWITVNPDSGENNGTVSVDVIANTGSSRVATLKISCSTETEYVQVKQKGEGLPTTGATSFSDDFSSVEATNQIYAGTGWTFTSSDTSWPSNVNYGWKTGVFNTDRYIQIAPYNSSLTTVAAYAVMTAFDMDNAPADGKKLSFDYTIYYQTADNSVFEVVASTDYDGNVNAATWTVVSDLTLAASEDNLNVWKHKIIDISSHTGITTFAFRYTGKSNTYRLDNVLFGPADIVPVVTTDEADEEGITDTGATLTGSYANDGGASIDKAGIAYKKGSDEFTYQDAPTNASAISVALSGLAANTTYTYFAYVKTVGGDEYRGAEKTFTTDMDANTKILYRENMGGTNVGSNTQIAIWNAATDGTKPERGGLGGFGAVYSASAAANGITIRTTSASTDVGSGGNNVWIAGTGSNWFQVDGILVGGANTIDLSFLRLSSANSWDANDNQLTVQLIRDGVPGNKLTYTASTANAWTKVSTGGIDVTGATTVGFRFTTMITDNTRGIRLDDLQLTTADAVDIVIVPVVTTMDAVGSNIDKTTATLTGSWTYTGSETVTAAGIAYRKKAGGGAYSYSEMASVPGDNKISAALTGLTAGTDYEYYAYVKTGADEHKGAVREFSTDALVVEQKAISYVRALKSNLDANTTSYTIDEDIKITGTLISGSNTNSSTIVLQDASTANSGITVYLGGAPHSYAAGDILTVELKGGSLTYRNGLLQLDMSAQTPNIAAGDNTPMAATAITCAQFMADDSYESMYVSIADVKVDFAALISSAAPTMRYNSGSVPVSNNDGSFVMYTNTYASFAAAALPTGAGTLSGIAGIYNTARQLIPQTAADFGSLTGGRDMEFGTPTIEGSYYVSSALGAANYIQVPYYFAQGTESYNYVLSMGGTGAAAISAGNATGTYQATTGATPRYVHIALTGTPTTAGTLNATITSGLPGAPLTTADVSVTVPGTAVEQVIYTTGFEAPDFAAGTSYNNTTPKVSGPAGKQWSTYYGTPSTTGPITGSQSMQMRWYTANAANLGYAETLFKLTKATKVSFKASNTQNGPNIKLQYSTDGTTWVDVNTYALTSTAAVYTGTVSADDGLDVYLRFSIPAAAAANGTRVVIDDIEVKGMVNP